MPNAETTRRAPAPHSPDNLADERQANEPLLLSPAMRTALASAVRELLHDSRLAGQSPLVKLTAVVLLAKAPLMSAVVDMTARDVGGWLGCSVSHVGHTLVPDAKKSGSILCAPKRSEEGRTVALRFELLPLREARAAAGGAPLGTLTKRELATLLRFCEAVTCPGWTPKDKPATSAGFMASRRERGAATDRLAMVLLCLEARADGRVRMAPGRVAQGIRRADVTVARLMGCEVDVAAAAVDRLVAAGELQLEGRSALMAVDFGCQRSQPLMRGCARYRQRSLPAVLPCWRMNRRRRVDRVHGAQGLNLPRTKWCWPVMGGLRRAWKTSCWPPPPPPLVHPGISRPRIR